jgi:hypothetical protein
MKNKIIYTLLISALLFGAAGLVANSKSHANVKTNPMIEVSDKKVEITTSANGYQATDVPEIKIKTTDANLGTLAKARSFLEGLFTNEENSKVIVKIKNQENKVIDEYKLDINNGDHVATLETNDLATGTYTVEITSVKTGQTAVQEFTWGVLAMNTDKAVYHPGETAEIDIAVLDEKGEMVCNAEVELTITDPNAQTTSLSTKEGTISVEPGCRSRELKLTPDYKAQTVLNDLGIYHFKLKAITENGEYEIVGSIEVDPNVPFSIKRTTATRIYPVNIYPVEIQITANQDFAGEITEKVPSGFAISHIEDEGKLRYESIDEQSKYSYIKWPVSLNKGDAITLGYAYDSPDISPNLYLLGPLTFTENSETKYTEPRKWQIAVDAVSYIDSTTANANNGADATLDLTAITTLQEDDLVIVAYSIGDNDNNDYDMALVSATGWTEVADLYSNDGRDANLGVFYKVMGTTPDTSVTVDGLGGTDTDTSAVAMAFRGVDTSTPMDVTDTEATGTNTMHPNPPSIDHNNPSGVFTVIAGANAHTQGAQSFTFPTGYTTNAVDQTGDDTTDGSVGLGYNTSPSDPEDPGTMTLSGSDSGQYSWAAVTMALRPAAPTISGKVYQGDESSDYNCNADNLTIKISDNGAAEETVTCDASDGTWSKQLSTFPDAGDPITVYIDSTETPQATTVFTFNSGDTAGINLYDDTVVVRHEDAGPINITDMDTGDNGDAGIRYAVSGGNLIVESGYELHVHTGDTFTPGGNVTTQGANGHVHIDDSATFTGASTQDHVISDDLLIDTLATFTAPSTEDDGTVDIGGSFTNSGTFTDGSGKVTFTATSGTETITSGGDAFYDLDIGETSGTATWNLSGAMDVDGVLTIDYGTLAMNGANNITLAQDLTINTNGDYKKGSGTVTFDGATDPVTWTDNNGTPVDMGDISIDGSKEVDLGSSVTAESVDITASDTLDLNSSSYTLTLTQTGTALTISGTLDDGTDSEVKFTGNGATTIPVGTYHDLSVHPGGTATHTTASGTIAVTGDLSVGDGSNTGTMEANTNDTIINVTGSMTINANGIYSASSNTTNDLDIQTNFTNNGTFTACCSADTAERKRSIYTGAISRILGGTSVYS